MTPKFIYYNLLVVLARNASITIPNDTLFIRSRRLFDRAYLAFAQYGAAPRFSGLRPSIRAATPALASAFKPLTPPQAARALPLRRDQKIPDDRHVLHVQRTRIVCLYRAHDRQFA